MVSEDCLASGVLEGLENLLVVDLSGNKLTSLPRGSLRGLRAVRRLDLSKNSVASVSKSLFDQLEGLQDLSLKGNELNAFDISGLSKSKDTLRKLDLSDNMILSLNSTSGAVFPKLEVLKIAKNKLQHLDLAPFMNLRKLSLEHNEVFKLTVSGDTSLDNLEELFLRSNRFTKVPEVLRLARGLRTLDLGLNLINAIEADAFEGLESLGVLRLEDNSIARVADLAFRSAPGLEILNLSGNLISGLTGRTFEGAGNVRALRLDSNSISEVEGVFHSMDHLTWLNMSGNDLEVFDWHFVPYSLK